MSEKLRKDLIKQRLNDEIEASNLTLTEIAKQVGCTKSILSQYKYNDKMPSVIMLAKICDVIGADANYILGITKK